MFKCECEEKLTRCELRFVAVTDTDSEPGNMLIEERKSQIFLSPYTVYFSSRLFLSHFWLTLHPTSHGAVDEGNRTNLMSWFKN